MAFELSVPPRRDAAWTIALVSLAFAAGWLGGGWHARTAPNEPHRRRLSQGWGRNTSTLDVSTPEARDDALVKLLNRMGAAKEIPFSIFGAGMPKHVAMRPPLSDKHVRQALGTPAIFERRKDQVYWLTQRALSRLAFIRFLGEAVDSYSSQAQGAARKQGAKVRCLEWDSPSYLAGYPACEEAWVFAYDARHARRGGPQQRHLWGDATELAFQFPELVGSFHIIFCNQVFEHMRQPHRAASNLAAMLAPGGVLIFTVPFLEPLHGVPLDFNRFTVGGAVALFEDVGLKPRRCAVAGNAHLTVAYLLGLGASEVRHDDLLANLVIPTTLKEQEWAADTDERGPLSRKLYMGSYVVFQAPTHGANRLFMWERKAWAPTPNLTSVRGGDTV